ncbi:MAG TPA: hypothetical protein VN764_10385, partial [Polyangiaceae bacterium]|nr:hypothetical protein [Polyangiaceae bacterium]
CALGQHNLVAVLVKCRLPLPAYILADEKHSRCLTERVYLPTIVGGRVILASGVQRLEKRGGIHGVLWPVPTGGP